jgi:SAM-dependent methyltransferase
VDAPDAVRRPRRGDVATAPRTAAVWEVVQRVVADLGPAPLVVLDVGGGTGGMAVPLAGLGHQVTVVDPSPDALAAFERRADEAGVVTQVRAVQADAAQLAQVAAARSVDLVCCHGVLEYVDEPAEALAGVAEVLRPGGVVSLLVAQRSAAVLARALAGRFVEAAHALDDPDGRWGAADPLPRRFDQPGLLDLVRAAGLQPRQVHGVRLFSDLVPEALVDGDEARSALLDLERRAGDHPEHPALAALATQLHVVAVRDER